FLREPPVVDRARVIAPGPHRSGEHDAARPQDARDLGGGEPRPVDVLEDVAADDDVVARVRDLRAVRDVRLEGVRNVARREVQLRYRNRGAGNAATADLALLS